MLAAIIIFGHFIYLFIDLYSHWSHILTTLSIAQGWVFIFVISFNPVFSSNIGSLSVICGN